jgi:glucose-6-phosphate dehydrogenase-like protein
MENHADLLVIFGITGDLARRMTFRALYRLEGRGLLGGPARSGRFEGGFQLLHRGQRAILVNRALANPALLRLGQGVLARLLALGQASLLLLPCRLMASRRCPVLQTDQHGAGCLYAPNGCGRRL